MFGDTPQQNLGADPAPITDPLAPSELPASPTTASDAETSEIPSRLNTADEVNNEAEEAQTSPPSPKASEGREPVSGPTEPVLEAPAPTAPQATEAPFDASQGKLSPVQTSQVWPSGFSGLLARANAALFSRRQKKLEKIMELVRQKGKIKNEEVCKLLRVSRTSAFRYLNDLERQGKLKQIGKTGHEVFYELVN